MAGKGKGGRPPTAFTPDMLAAAKFLLGRRQYVSVAVQELRQKLKGHGRDAAYRLCEAARLEALEDIRQAQQTADPLVGCALLFQSIMGDDAIDPGHRINAGKALVRLLSLDRLAAKAQAKTGAVSEDEYEEWLAGFFPRKLGLDPEDAARQAQMERWHEENEALKRAADATAPAAPVAPVVR